jgi:hypothetical protein
MIAGFLPSHLKLTAEILMKCEGLEMVQADELRRGDRGGFHCATCRNSYLAASHTTHRGIHNHVSVESITALREDGKCHHRSNRRLEKERLASSGLEVRFVEFSNGSVFVVSPRVFSTLHQRIA